MRKKILKTTQALQVSDEDQKWYDREVWLRHEGKTIIVHNYGGLDGEETIALASFVARRALNRRVGSLRILVDIENLVPPQQVIAEISSQVETFKSLILKLGILGQTGCTAELVSALGDRQVSDVQAFTSREEALNWLIRD